MIRIRFTFLFFIAISVSCCGTGDNLVFFMKPYTKELFDTERLKNLANACADYGFSFATKIIENETPSILTQLVKSTKASVCLLDPVLATLPTELAAASPEVFFISVLRGQSGFDSGLPNLLAVSFEREKALRSSGAIAGMLINDKAMNARFSVPGNQAPLFAAIYYQSLLDAESESGAIKEGFLSIAPERAYASVRVENIETAEEANRALTKLHGDGARIFYIGMYSQNTACLETLRRLGGFAIMDDWHPGYGYADIVLFGISEDYSEMLEKSLSLYRSRNSSGGDTAAPSVSVHTRIAWGKVIPIPGKAADLMAR